MDVPVNREVDPAIATVIYDRKQHRLTVHVDNVGMIPGKMLLDTCSAMLADRLGPDTSIVGDGGVRKFRSGEPISEVAHG
jgi:hypothetical protein